MKKLISISTPCYNEEGNVRNLYNAVKKVMSTLPQYEYHHLFIDNSSTDATASILRDLAREDPEHVRVIFNERNFGPDRSSAYGVFACDGECVIGLACDLQDPPEMIPQFLQKWEEGYKVVWGQKTSSQESRVMYRIRGLYYKIIKSFSNVKQYEQVTGFGLYDQKVLKVLKNCKEPDPLFRNLVTEMGYEVALITYTQPARRVGKSSYNFFRYLDTAISSLTNTSKVPIRVATILGSIFSAISFLICIIYLVLKILYWNRFAAGTIPVLLGLFFFGSVQLLFIGLVGEYVSQILDRAKNRPLLIEKERLNFDEETSEEKESVNV